MKDLEKRIAALLAAKAKALSPSARDLLAGVGQAFDPAPREYRKLFIESDLAACAADLQALYLDWCSVHHRLRGVTPKNVLGETHDFHERSVRDITADRPRAAERERQHA